MEASAVSARLIGAIFVDKGLISDAELERALDEQERTGLRLGEILVSSFGVSRLDLSSALAEQWTAIERASTPVHSEPTPSIVRRDADDLAAIEQEWRPPSDEATHEDKRPIGEIFVEKGVITEEQLGRALDEQRQTGARLGEILVAQETLTRLELASALAEQWSDLQKLRPPEPRPLRAVGPPEPRRSASSPDTSQHEASQIRQELRAAVADLEKRIAAITIDEPLEGRLRAVEDAVSGTTRGIDEIRAEIQEATKRLGELSDGDGSDDGSIERIHRSIEQLAQRVAMAEELTRRAEQSDASVDDDLGRRVDELEGRIQAFASEAAIAELQTRLDAHEAQLSHPESVSRAEIDETTSRLSAAIASLSSLEEMRPVVDELAQRARASGERRSDSADPAAIEELHATIARFEERLSATVALAERLQRVEQSLPDHNRIATRQDELAQRLDELGQRVGTDAWESELSDLRQRIAAFDARIAGSETTAREELAGARDLEDLRAHVSSLEAEIAATADASEDIRAAAADIEPRLDEVANTLSARLERLEEHDGRVAEALRAADDTRRELDEIAARVAELATAAPDETTAKRIAAIDMRLGELATRVANAAWQSDVDTTIARLEVAIAALQASTPGGDTVLQQISELEARFAELAADVTSLRDLDSTKAATDASIAELRAALTDATARLAGSASEEAVSAVSRSVEQLAAELTELRGEDLSVRIDDLAERLTALQPTLDVEGALALHAGELETVAGELRARIERHAQRLDGIDEKQLGERVVELSSQVEQHLARIDSEISDRMRSELAELGERMDSLDTAVERIADDNGVELREQLDATAKTLHERLDNHEQRLATSTTDELGARIDRLAQMLADTASHDELHERIADLSNRVEALPDPEGIDQLGAELRSRSATLEARLREHQELLRSTRETLDTVGSVETLDATLHELDARDESLRNALAVLADELTARVAASETHLACIDDEVGRRATTASVDELRAARAAIDERLDDHERRLAANTTDELETRVDRLAERLADTAASGELRELEGKLRQLDTRDGELHETLTALTEETATRIAASETHLARLRDEVGRRATTASVDELRAARTAIDERLDDHERALDTALARESEIDARLADADELPGRLERSEQRLDVLEDRGDWGLEGRLDDLGADLRQRLDRHDRRLEKHARKLDDLRESADHAATALNGRVEKRLATIEQKAVAAADSTRSMLEQTSDRIDLLDAALGDQGQRALDATSDLRAALAELDGRVATQAHALERRTHELIEAQNDEIDTRLDELASADVVDALRARLEILEHALADRFAKDAEHVTAHRDLVERLESLDTTVNERVGAASVATERKLEAVVRAIDDELSTSRGTLERTVAELRSQIVDQADLAERQAGASEQALRDGLAALGSQLAEGESGYLRAGELLRASIERLGGAIGETDRRIAARGERLPVASADEATSYLAFAPGTSGYRLIEAQGSPPAIGEAVQLPGEHSPLVVARISTSPLPLDLRPCVYFER